jgi:hypothetical protein
LLFQPRSTGYLDRFLAYRFDSEVNAFWFS